jgi:hypothetical protein
MAERRNSTDWNTEDAYWRSSYRTRPYAGSNDYSYYQPGYRYGYEAASKYEGREWSDVEPELERNWDTYEYRGQSTWEHMKAAIRDAWDRVTGHHHVSSR